MFFVELVMAVAIILLTVTMVTSAVLLVRWFLKRPPSKPPHTAEREIDRVVD